MRSKIILFIFLNRCCTSLITNNMNLHSTDHIYNVPNTNPFVSNNSNEESIESVYKSVSMSVLRANEIYDSGDKRNKSKKRLEKNYLSTTTLRNFRSGSSSKKRDYVFNKITDRLKNRDKRQISTEKFKYNAVYELLDIKDEPILDMNKFSQIYATLINYQYNHYGRDILYGDNIAQDRIYKIDNDIWTHYFYQKIVSIFMKHLYLYDKEFFNSNNEVILEYDCENINLVYISFEGNVEGTSDLSGNDGCYKCKYDYDIPEPINLEDLIMNHSNGVVHDFPTNSKIYYKFDFAKKEIFKFIGDKNYFRNNKDNDHSFKRYISSKDGFFGVKACWAYQSASKQKNEKFLKNIEGLFENKIDDCNTLMKTIIKAYKDSYPRYYAFKLDDESQSLKINLHGWKKGVLCPLQEKEYLKIYIATQNTNENIWPGKKSKKYNRKNSKSGNDEKLVADKDSGCLKKKYTTKSIKNIDKSEDFKFSNEKNYEDISKPNINANRQIELVNEDKFTKNHKGSRNKRPTEHLKPHDLKKPEYKEGALNINSVFQVKSGDLNPGKFRKNKKDGVNFQNESSSQIKYNVTNVYLPFTNETKSFFSDRKNDCSKQEFMGKSGVLNPTDSNGVNGVGIDKTSVFFLSLCLLLFLEYLVIFDYLAFVEF